MTVLYSYEIDGGIKVDVTSSGAGKPPSLVFSKTGITPDQKAKAEKTFLDKIVGLDSKQLEPLARDFKNAEEAKAILGGPKATAIDKALLAQMDALKVTYGAPVNFLYSKNPKTRTAVKETETPKSEEKKADTSEKYADTSGIFENAKAKDKIKTLLTSKTGVNMDVAGQRPFKIDASLQGLQSIIYLNDATDNPIFVDGKHGRQSLIGWNNFKKQYQSDFDQFSAENKVSGELNSDQAYAFGLWVIQHNDGARQNIARGLREVGNQYEAHKNSLQDGTHKKSSTIKYEDYFKAVQIHANLFDGAGLKIGEFFDSNSVKTKKGNVSVDDYSKTSSTENWMKTYADKYRLVDRIVTPGNKSDQIMDLGVKPVIQNVLDKVIPQVPKVIYPKLIVAGSPQLPDDMGKKENRKELAKYGEFADSCGPVVHVTGDNSRVIVIKNQNAMYDQIGELNNNKDLGLETVSLSKDNLERLNTIWKTYEDQKMITPGNDGTAQYGMVFTPGVHGSRSNNDNNVQIWFRKSPDGSMEARIITDKLRRDNPMIDKAIQNSAALKARVDFDDKGTNLGSYARTPIVRESFNKSVSNVLKSPNPAAETDIKTEKTPVGTVSPGDLKKEASRSGFNVLGNSAENNLGLLMDSDKKPVSGLTKTAVPGAPS